MPKVPPASLVSSRHVIAAALVTVSCWAPAAASPVTDWNAITLVCVQGRPTPLPAIPPNRGGPPGLLDIALIQAAVSDAVQAVQGRFESYRYANAALLGAGSPNAAAAAATHDMLVALYGAADECLVGVVDPDVTFAGDAGLQAGHEAASALLPHYRPTIPTAPFYGGTEPGEWRPTPGITQGANLFMALTEPFVLDRARQFRPPPPAPLKSERYRREYDEVKDYGALNSTVRTAEQTDLARFWSVNFIVQWFATVRAIADAHLADAGDQARLLALVSMAAADGQITVYETKYHYSFWRPITAIREGDNDGNPNTVGDPAWTSWIAVNPPYPDHSSGANSLAGSILGTLQLFFGTDDMLFSVSSSASPLNVNPRIYTRFSDAMQDIVEVRILQGIHFRSADEVGRMQGLRVAHWIFHKALRPVPPRR